MGTKLAVSPLAPANFPDLPDIGGVQFASVSAGVRYADRDDVMLVSLAPGTSIAGVFTRSSTRSAAVLDCQSKMGVCSEKGAAILVNSGNANAFTGRAGMDAVTKIVDGVAQQLDLPTNRVLTASTGVIGESLPFDRVLEKLDTLSRALSASGIGAAAQAIMTTDTYPKGSCKTVDINGSTVRISGIAKGSGMIAPDMATMLVYIFTDAAIDQATWQTLVADTANKTFNCITVDSDTSTSDTLIAAATGISGVNVSSEAIFADALYEVMLDLAHQVVRDGEGATKFIEVNVTGAATKQDAKQVAMSIANSPLVKTAFAGEDPNWGRIVMAVGKSGAKADRDALSIRFGDILVAEKGWVAPDYREEDGADYMKNDEIVVHADLGVGEHSSTAWTCDLTHGYISINADYRS